MRIFYRVLGVMRDIATGARRDGGDDSATGSPFGTSQFGTSSFGKEIS